MSAKKVIYFTESVDVVSSALERLYWDEQTKSIVVVPKRATVAYVYQDAPDRKERFITRKCFAHFAYARSHGAFWANVRKAPSVETAVVGLDGVVFARRSTESMAGENNVVIISSSLGDRIEVRIDGPGRAPDALDAAHALMEHFNSTARSPGEKYTLISLTTTFGGQDA